MRSLLFPKIVLILLICLTGCSSLTNGSNPTESALEQTSSDTLDSIPVIGQTLDTAVGLLGAYSLVLSESGLEADLVPLRSSAIGESYIVSAMGFFAMTPCSDCLKIRNISLNDDNNLVVGFIVKHPFPMGNPLKPVNWRNRKDLDIFDLALLVKPVDGGAEFYSGIMANVFTGIMANAEGYTRELENLLKNPAAIPYKICYESVNNNRFAMGTEYQPFQVELTPGENMIFDLYLTTGYGAAAKKATFMTPVYYIPEFNRKAAWKVMVTPPEGDDPPVIGNTWDSDDNTTAYPVTIDIYDWNHGATVSPIYPDPGNTNQISAASNIGTVSVEIPGMTSSAVSATTLDTTTNGWYDPLTFIANIANANGLEPGSYTGLVKVSDTRIPAVLSGPYTPGTMVHSPNGILLEWYQIPEYATYQTFTATVVDATPCLPPVPTSIVPAILVSDPGIYNGNITIHGNYFTGDGGVTDVYLDNSITQYHAYGINVVNDTTLTCSLNISGAVNGIYDLVVVTACDGRATVLVEITDTYAIQQWRCFQYDETNLGYNLFPQSFDPLTCTQKWYKARPGYKYSGPAVTDIHTFVTENSSSSSSYWFHKCVCYDNLNTGNLLWQKRINYTGDSSMKACTSPVWFEDVHNNRVAVGGDRVWCLDAVTGDIEWEYGFVAYDFYGNSPKYYGGNIYITGNGYVHCINSLDGTGIWMSNAGVAAPESTPTIVDDLIYVRNPYGGITCLYANGLQEGDIKWTSLDYGSYPYSYWSTPCVLNGRVYFCSIPSLFICLDADDGSLIWQYTGSGLWLSAVTAWIDPSDDMPVLFFTSAYASSPGLIALKDFGIYGAIFWQSLNYNSESSPVINNNIVYAGSSNGDWYGYDVETGTQVFYRSLSGAVRSAAGFAYDMMVVPTQNGVYIFE